MDKTFLEKRIENKAREEFEDEWNDFVIQMYNHPIFKHITIKIEEKDIPLVNFGINYGVFNQKQDKNPRNNFLNFEDVKEKVVQEKIKEKTDELLSRLSSVNYLFEKEEL
ncbi:hypothetical protein NMM18_05170 [Streptococcus oralis]|uniref:hypothetical protein n=1 Tax=Streptococcus oralis TaxID=1303 RepID=UPI0020C88316|nr:hypothetical protein [Streptococcus oralis]MCP9037480.1 hypothetical protein [Streptococcus oralis]MCP9052935.1 hypothetical protein [Streptococcus oralis]MCP9057966.1 hypothetical protein [Streptococcus oralis]MCP9065199.1 hypothetical protein [Streptococcus oralis]MCP9069760.1 hypothetical protein [Streptococcus oralis]